MIGVLPMSTPPLPPPERFESKSVSGYQVDRVSIGKRDGSVALVMTHPEHNLSLVFVTSAAGARQVAASLLNQADDVDGGYPAS